jgi:hypothetical protein
MCPNEPWPALRLPPFTSETRSRRSFHSAVTSCLSGRIVTFNLQEITRNYITFVGMYLIIKPSEEKLSQIEEADVDIATGVFLLVPKRDQEHDPASTPPNELLDQFGRKRLICLVMLRHFLQDFSFPAPVKSKFLSMMHCKCRCHETHQFSSICEGASTKSRATLVPWKRENCVRLSKP